MIQSHAEAIRSLLTSAGIAAHLEPPRAPSLNAYPYVVIYLDGGERSSERLALAGHRADFVFSTITVGITSASVNIIRAKVLDALTFGLPVVEGRRCSRINHVSSLRTTNDDAVVDRIAYSGADNWAFDSSSLAA